MVTIDDIIGGKRLLLIIINFENAKTMLGKQRRNANL